MSAKVTVTIFFFALHSNAALLGSSGPLYSEEDNIEDPAAVESNENLRSCRDDEFQCQNGECIKDQLLCDGRVDCSDLSDESFSPCAHPLLMCPESAFRCNYGACVHQDQVCDGVKDCDDNSDELLDCPQNPPPERPIYVRVNADEKYKHYNPEHETLPWFIYAIRPRMTGKTPAVEPKIQPSSSLRSLKLLNAPRTGALMNTRCPVPPQPLNGHWQLHRQFCEGDENCDILQGNTLESGSRLVYSCDADFSPRGNTDVYCEAGGNWTRLPECIANTSCAPLNSISRAASCSRFGERVNCSSPILPRTRAKVTCRMNYGLDPNSVRTAAEQNVECNQNGAWEPEPIKCRPICGLENRSSQQQETVNGISGDAGSFPWHANVWKYDSSRRTVLCSGTIIQSKLVLTKVICILNDITRLPEDPAFLLVTVGSANPNSNNSRDISSTNHKVKNVYRNCLDPNLVFNYTSDIAVIELSEPFQFSDTVLPVCLDIARQTEQDLLSGVTGKVDRFRETPNRFHDLKLKTVNVSYSSNSECRTQGPRKEVIIKNDEFYGVVADETIFSTNEAGHGLVVKKRGLWYLVGTQAWTEVSLFHSASPSQGDWDSPYCSKYTKISAYMTWIQDILFQLERYKSYPACSSYIPPRSMTTEPLAARRGVPIPTETHPEAPFGAVAVAGPASKQGVFSATAVNSGHSGGGSENYGSRYEGGGSGGDLGGGVGQDNVISALSFFTAQMQSNGESLATGPPVTPNTTPSTTFSTMPPRAMPTTTTAAQTPIGLGLQTTSNRENVFCIIPPQPENGQWKLHPSHCEDNTNCTFPVGTALGPSIRLLYNCRPGFRLLGSPDVVCKRQSGKWSSIPTCIENTCPSLDSPSRIVTCYRSNSWTTCGSLALPNTTASLSCRPGYEEDSNLSTVRSKTVTCNGNGEWEPNPITCLPVCGITQFDLIMPNGVPANISQFPWHATLYRQEKPPEGPKEFKCDATLIQNNLLLTKADCVYDKRFNMVDLAERFHVITGNEFRDYDSPRHDPWVVQKAAVKSIHVPCEYAVLADYYNYDIAIIELREPFQLSTNLTPVCIDVLGTDEQLGKSSPIGQFPVLVRTTTGSSSTMKWYVTGIGNSVDKAHYYSTSIFDYQAWIRNVMFNLERYGYYPSCELNAY